ncbi:hypothetical protein [Novilysobacter defluvii]|nr:hypothetical protein [Lysobacter defluvii]
MKAGEAYKLARSYGSLALKWAGELIDEALVRRDLRFLQLAPETVDALGNTLSATQHWFSLLGLCTAESGVLVRSQPGRTLRCIRPMGETSRVLFRPGHPLDGILPPPYQHAAEFEVKVDVNNIVVETHFIDELKAFVAGAIPDDDRHRLGHDAPAVLHVYRAAQKYSATLAALHRGNAPKDKERLRAAREMVDKFLARHGGAFKTKRVRNVVFRVIDPKHAWGRGPGATSFKALASNLGLEREFDGEPYVTDPLGILITMAKDIIRAHAQADAAGPHWSRSHIATMDELSAMGFKGNEVQDVLAGVLRRSLSQSPVTASRSVKKSDPFYDAT